MSAQSSSVVAGGEAAGRSVAVVVADAFENLLFLLPDPSVSDQEKLTATRNFKQMQVRINQQAGQLIEEGALKETEVSHLSSLFEKGNEAIEKFCPTRPPSSDLVSLAQKTVIELLTNLQDPTTSHQTKLRLVHQVKALRPRLEEQAALMLDREEVDSESVTSILSLLDQVNEEVEKVRSKSCASSSSSDGCPPPAGGGLTYSPQFTNIARAARMNEPLFNPLEAERQLADLYELKDCAERLLGKASKSDIEQIRQRRHVAAANFGRIKAVVPKESADLLEAALAEVDQMLCFLTK